MEKIFLTVLISLLSIISKAQVAEMNWELDYQIYLKLANDSNYVYDIRDAFHVKGAKEEFLSDFIFYPVNPGQEFATEVSGQEKSDTAYKTLWSALHAKLGGGWIHFSNCIAYALETKNLRLTSPLMKRPQSDWKPKPMTESYRRTKNWPYYVPVSQKEAQKEYKVRLKNNTLGDIKSLPQSYTELFLNTSQNDYERLVIEGKKDVVAKIDLVKVILGANYLSDVQINYMSNAILEAVLSYSSNILPSVIIFDEYDAAVAMSLNTNGYRVENIVYRASANISEREAERRKIEIESVVAKINQYNHNSFRKRLGKYYHD